MSEKAGPELDAKLAELLGWRKPSERGRCDVCGWPVVPADEPGCWASNCSMRPMPSPRADVPAPYSCRTDLAISAAEEMRKAGKIDAWDIHQFETSSASTGRLMPDGRTLAWSDAAQGDPESVDPRAHALTLALVAALSAEPVESMK